MGHLLKVLGLFEALANVKNLDGRVVCAAGGQKLSAQVELQCRQWEVLTDLVFENAHLTLTGRRRALSVDHLSALIRLGRAHVLRHRRSVVLVLCGLGKEREIWLGPVPQLVPTVQRIAAGLSASFEQAEAAIVQASAEGDERLAAASLAWEVDCVGR